MISPSQSSSQSNVSAEKQQVWQFVGFFLDGQQYAFRIEQIQEIVVVPQITMIPNVPDFVEGVSNLRGSIIPIINLRGMMRMRAVEPDNETRIIVVNVDGRTIGCTVDSVTQVIRVPAESIQPAPDTVVTDRADYVTGFATVNDQLLVLLDVNRLLDPARLGSV